MARSYRRLDVDLSNVPTRNYAPVFRSGSPLLIWLGYVRN